MFVSEANTNAPAIMIAERAADLIRFGSHPNWRPPTVQNEIGELADYEEDDYEADYHHYYRRSLLAEEAADDGAEWNTRNDTTGHDQGLHSSMASSWFGSETMLAKRR